MKQKSFLVIIMVAFLGGYFNAQSQITAAGDIAFTAFNSDGDDDFAIVALVDISSNTTIYFTDKATDGNAFTDTGSDGFLTWNSGSTIINVGTIVVFTDTDNSSNLEYGASIGVLTSPENVILVATGETLFAYLGTDQNTPTTFLAGIKNAALTVGELNNTGLTAGTNFLEFNPTVSPDGGYFSASRSSQTTYANYLSVINNKANWEHNTSDGEATLPISTTGFTISTTIWSGATDSDWTVAGNWSNGIPDNSFQVSIPFVTIKPIISSGTTYTIGNLTIDASSSLNINAGSGLTVSGNLTNSGTFNINSDVTSSGSLIVTGTSTGNVTYNRYMTGVDKWHLIAAPIGEQSINTFVTTAANNVGTSGVNYSVTPYDNSFAKGTTGTWTHWTSDGTNTVSGAGNFIAGKGYEILTTADGTVAFTGTVPVAQVSIGVTANVTNDWNLIGNPFPSSISANSNANAPNNFITINASAMDASYQALYFWNPGAGSYNLINQIAASTYIAPGQGFFVKSVAGGSTVNFTTAMRSNQSAVTFQKIATTPLPSITIIADDNIGKTIKTDIKYMDGMSLGLDPGYDAGRFGGTGAGNFGLYSHLVEDNNVDFALQVVPDTGYDTTIIPIGLDALAGTTVTFKAVATDLPLGKKVFIEDKLLNTVSELNNSDKTYTITLSSGSNGIGRFYIHTQDNASTLGVDAIIKSKFTLVASPNLNLIKVFGLIEQTGSLDLYDVLGRQVYTAKLEAGTTNDIQVPSMATGVYFVKIKTAKVNYNQKIIWY